MPQTIGIVANIYNEAAAIGGWIESALQFFDDVRVYHAGPGGAYSNDGTIEIVEKWRIPITYGTIDDGFGCVRSAAMRYSPCDWVLIADADERFHAHAPMIECQGASTPPDEANTILQHYDFRDLNTLIPNWENLRGLGRNLTVRHMGTHSQGDYLRYLISVHLDCDAILFRRRHWHDFTWKHPTQNWHTDPDWQCRFLRRLDRIYYEPDIKMHEQIRGVINPLRPEESIGANMGPYLDHYHFSFKRMEMHQRAHDIEIYNAIHAGRKPPSFEEFSAK